MVMLENYVVMLMSFMSVVMMYLSYLTVSSQVNTVLACFVCILILKFSVILKGENVNKQLVQSHRGFLGKWAGVVHSSKFRKWWGVLASETKILTKTTQFSFFFLNDCYDLNAITLLGRGFFVFPSLARQKKNPLPDDVCFLLEHV